MISVGAAGLAWRLMPSSPPYEDFPTSLWGGVYVASDVSGVNITVDRFGEDVWGVEVVVYVNTRPRSKPSLGLDYVSVGSCSDLKTGSALLDLEDCDKTNSRTVIQGGFPHAEATTDWVQAPGEPRTGPASASFLVPVRAPAASLGISETDSDLRISLPFLWAGAVSDTKPVLFNYTLGTSRGTQMDWTGVQPSAVRSDHVLWAYYIQKSVASPRLVQGHDLARAADDQRRTFVAGALAGIAGGGLIAALGQVFEAALAHGPGRRRPHETVTD